MSRRNQAEATLHTILAPSSEDTQISAETSLHSDGPVDEVLDVPHVTKVVSR